MNSRRYRPNMYQIARLEMEALAKLFVGSELALLDVEKGHALNLVTQVVPHFAQMMSPFSYPICKGLGRNPVGRVLPSALSGP